MSTNSNIADFIQVIQDDFEGCHQISDFIKNHSETNKELLELKQKFS